MEQVFGKEWFANPKTQSKLLWLLNHSRYFRQDMAIQDHDLPFSEKIVRIEPNSFTWRTGEREFMTDFRTHNKFGKRLYYGFLPIWNLAHKFDMSVANRLVPALNLGFDTLTAYPGSIGTDNPVDGRIFRSSVNEDWATIISSSGTLAQTTTTAGDVMTISTSGTPNRFDQYIRSIFCFDTSSIGVGEQVTDAVLSLFGVVKSDTWTTPIAPDIDIYTASPASTTTLATGDYSSLGSVSQTTGPISYASWSDSAYNDFTFHATGKGNISLTGISKFGTRNANYDVAASAPAWESNKTATLSCYFSNQTGTDNDPKLVVTYEEAVTATGNFFMFM